MRSLTLALALLSILAGCLSAGTVTPLSGTEVREYRGKNLSSLNDFIENSIKGPQYVNISAYRLVVDGLVDNPRSYAYGEVLAHDRYSKVVRLDCVEGWSVDILWEGVLVRDLLAEAKVRPQANTVILHAEDGYTTSFPLSYFMDKDILLAYGMNNVTMPPERGYPSRLVAEDKWGYKWIKWVTRIELSDNPDYKGYWESRGYSDTGDRDKPF